MNLKIVAIVDEYQVIVNAGKNQQIEVGTVFKIKSKPIEIIDEDNNSSLGEVSLDKAEIKATKVYDNMCICESSENHSGGYMIKETKIDPDILGCFTDPVYQKLNINVTDLSKSLSYKGLAIRIGDPVEKV